MKQEDKKQQSTLVYQLPEAVLLDIISKLRGCQYREVEHIIPALKNMVREARKNHKIKIEKN